MTTQRSWWVICLWLVFGSQITAHPLAVHSGQVVSRGVPVPGVVVRVSLSDLYFETITDREGRYSFRNLTNGTWSLRLEMSGFEPAVHNLAIAPDTPDALWDLEMLPLGSLLPTPRFRPDGELLEQAVTLQPPLQANLNLPSRDSSVAEVLLITGSVDTDGSPIFGNNTNIDPAVYSGSADLRVNNSSMNASPYSLTGQAIPQPAYSRADVLLSLAGPLPLPFLGRRGPRSTIVYGRAQNQDLSLQTARMPTVSERLGDFAGHTNMVLDPATGTPFPGNLIPTGQISTQAAALLNLYPLPNRGASMPYNYEISTVGETRRDSVQFQTGGTVNENRLTGGFGFQSNRGDSPNLFSFVDRQRTSVVNASLGWSRIFEGDFGVTVSSSFSRTASEFTPYFANQQNVSGNAGIDGNSQDPRDWGPPNLNFASGFASLSEAQHAFNRSQSSAVSIGATWTEGRHNLRFGSGYRREQVNVLSQQNARGTFSFTGAASGIDFADFLLGIPTTSAIAFGNRDKYFRQSQFDAYVMDDWRVTPGFTINVGLRWDYEAPVTELYGRLVNLDLNPTFSAAAPVLAEDPRGSVTGDLYPSSLVRPDKRGFQPRIGLAWRPFTNASMVVRAGWGIYRSGAVYHSIATEMAQQSPLSTSMNVENSPSAPITLANGFAATPSTTPNTYAVDPNFRVGQAQNWQLSLQQDLPAALQLTLAYLGTKGTNIQQRSLPNTFPVGGVASCVGCPTGYIYLSSHGASNQHAGTIALRRRQRNGLATSVQYTWSKAIDNAGPGTFHVAQDWQELSAERALSNFDRRHQLTFQLSYSTGMLNSLGGVSGGWIGTILRDWTIVADWTASSGSPLTPSMAVPVPGTGVSGVLRPDRSGTPLYTNGPEVFLNSAAFSPPETGQWGNAGRNSITGPGIISLDASVGRTFRISEGMIMDLRVDATNVLNHVTFPAWNTIVNSSQFGAPTHANPMRTLRPSLRVRF